MLHEVSYFFFARVRIIGTLVPFCVIGNSLEFPITQKTATLSPVWRLLIFMRHRGFEPRTTWLKVKCSTDWANTPYAQNRNRTSDTRIFSPLLYQLSYLGVMVIGFMRIKSLLVAFFSPKCSAQKLRFFAYGIRRILLKIYPSKIMQAYFWLLYFYACTSHCIKKLRGQDLNLRPSGYEPDELPDCSTPR